LYWSVQTIATVGYGDIPATTETELLMSIMWMFFGVGFFSFTIGNLSSALASMDTKSAILKRKLMTLTDFSKKIDLPMSMELRIRKFLEDTNND
jgi:voltage-gated potassium channel Kch